jgi:hypothetical protein
MSENHNVYIGAFLKCNVMHNKTLMERFGCPKCKTHFFIDNEYESGKYCRHCGSKHNSYESTEGQETISIDDIQEKLNYKLCPILLQKYIHIWVGIKEHNDYGFNLEEAGSTFRKLETNSPKELQTEFSKNYTTEINKLIEIYGWSYVEVCWGVITTVNQEEENEQTAS